MQKRLVIVMETLKKTNRIFMATTGDRFLYEQEVRNIMVKFSVREKIDATCLRQAADAMMERCPYFHTKSILINDRYCLVEQDDSIPVLENDGHILPTDERSEGFLLVISYSGNTIYICAHHALSDTIGVLRFTRSLAAFYLSLVTGKELHVPGELRPGQPVSEAEYEDPNLYITHQDQPFILSKKEGFTFPKEDISENFCSMRFSVPVESLLRISKNAEGSFSSVFATLMVRSLQTVYPSYEGNFKIYCPVEVRDMLGCPENMQNCVCGIDFDYSKKMQKMPFEQQLSCLKGILMLKNAEEYLLNSLENKKISHDKILENAKSLEDIKVHYNNVKYATPLLTYVKTVDFGDATPFIEELDITIPARGESGFTLVIYCIGDKCILKFISSLKSKDIFDSFEAALDDLSIPYEVIQKTGFGTEDFFMKDWMKKEVKR